MQLYFRSKSPKITYVLFGILLLLALVNILTPLRLNTDGIRYFSIMLFLKGQLAANDYAGKDFLPHGYSILLKTLSQVNLLNAKVIVALNIAAIFCAGYLVCRIYKIKQVLLIIALMLLSYVNIKHLTLPVSDLLFTGSLFASIYCWTKALTTNKRAFYLPAILLTLACIYLRTAGIVIIAGLILYALVANREKLWARTWQMIVISLVIIAGVVAFLIKLPVLEAGNDYFRQLGIEALLHDPVALFNRFGIHFKEIGEFTLNIPASKLSAILHSGNNPMVDEMLMLIGLITFAIMIYSGLKAKMYNQPAGCIYFTYLVLVFIWPFYDARFLIPAIPFFICSIYWFYTEKRLLVTKLFLGIYLLLGMASLIYSDMLSVNKNLFLKFYGNDKDLSANYKAHFQNPAAKADINKQRVLYILNHYDK